MSELQEQIYQMFTTPQLASLATLTEDGKPWSRYVMTHADRDLTLRIATFVQANKVKQIRANPEVHLNCGVSSLESARQFLQIAGRAQVSTREDDRHAIWSDGLKSYFSGPDDPNMAVIIVKPYRIEHHSMQARQPRVWEP